MTDFEKLKKELQLTEEQNKLLEKFVKESADELRNYIDNSISRYERTKADNDRTFKEESIIYLCEFFDKYLVGESRCPLHDIDSFILKNEKRFKPYYVYVVKSSKDDLVLSDVIYIEGWCFDEIDTTTGDGQLISFHLDELDADNIMKVMKGIRDNMRRKEEKNMECVGTYNYY